ncbi:hypothetical protein A2W14_01630 [Candidatus Gottesmanbacteria bacterium RBG_16_37_8]|uniref:Glycosyltransferase 2-like domain-containing protein n=1 Tax=Candidatus Gottesmanbacteria bacterium RBG_16_37_8 TaxID=1798371 RepID=A0A1F5YRG6_9BACT|nr:MAG: hypothetical protein A2W14_01630 [Candidatus Gottesmanbacteria bacterium RBG_16_37_8]
MRIFCLIPAYNEKENLKPLINKLTKILPKFSPNYLIYFVIQGDDGSIAELKKIKSINKKIDWIYFKNPLGIGRAYKKGFDKVTGKFSHVLTLDADLNHDPKEIGQFIAKMKDGEADLVIGSRFIKGGSFNDKRRWKRIISLLMNKVMTYFWKINVHDISSGYRLMKRGLILDIRSDLKESGYPNYMELVIRSAQKGYKLKEIPIKYQARIWGESKMGKWRTLIDYLGFLSRMIFSI